MQNTISAVDFFAAKLAHQTDPADLAAARAAGAAPLVLDVRDAVSWGQGRIPGAVHLPGRRVRGGIADLAPDRDTPIVVYCWGPGCNGATKAAFALADSGYTQVRELIGGFEYWAREGLAVVTDRGRTRRTPDALVAPAGAPGKLLDGRAAPC
ncbi:rhodanese-like domain-containing protein [Kineococcus sp. SYSU DK003]|uniref:rhodanese-like domain-containing protein n=1 Tax=Kineococcus sp. SYSU DK003 TaxID=3383124 RepID=UPI003D7E65BB